MIQRIQSLYLLLGAACLFPAALLEITTLAQVDETLTWYEPALTIVGVATMVIALGAIFFYKNRPKQQKLVSAVQVMTIIFLIILVAGLVIADGLAQLTQGGVDAVSIILIALPLLAYVFFWLARRGIQRDIDLVKSMDRLR